MSIVCLWIAMNTNAFGIDMALTVDGIILLIASIKYFAKNVTHKLW